MEKLDRPQIITHLEKDLDYTVYDGKWVPCSAKFVVAGNRAKGDGVIQLYQMAQGGIELLKEIEQPSPFKCCSFGASRLRHRHLATGNFAGELEIWNLERLDSPLYSVRAHDGIINCMDGVGGHSIACGAPEIATGGRDGTVKVWDPRQKEDPVAVMEPVTGEESRDCWSVAFGDSYNNIERIVAAGYDNGDIKIFDLRKMKVRWETNIKNGVCGMEFDRQDIGMNKLVVTSLESKFYLYEMRTQHPKKGFAYLKEKAHKSTIWTARHLPQNRDLFMTCGGNGSICLWKYEYPMKRWTEDMEGVRCGVVGKLVLLQSCALTYQPVSSFDWSPDKKGLALAVSFDQKVRLIIVTKLYRY